MNKRFFIEAFRYGIVGVCNTLLTAAVIWVMMYWVYDLNRESDASMIQMFVSNFAGYGVGVICSFVLNRNWTFKSKVGWREGIIKFLIVFFICYLIQLLVVFILNRNTTILPYFCQLLGMVVYTLLNFLANKYYTFREKKEG